MSLRKPLLEARRQAKLTGEKGHDHSEYKEYAKSCETARKEKIFQPFNHD
jgi:hypothetical protein